MRVDIGMTSGFSGFYRENGGIFSDFPDQDVEILARVVEMLKRISLEIAGNLR
jgi:hypothetical protein